MYGYVYLAQVTFRGVSEYRGNSLYKVGSTTRHPEIRVKEHERTYTKIKLIESVETSIYPGGVEDVLHSMYKDYKYPSSRVMEVFYLPEEWANRFKQHAIRAEKTWVENTKRRHEAMEVAELFREHYDDIVEWLKSTGKIE